MTNTSCSKDAACETWSLSASLGKASLLLIQPLSYSQFNCLIRHYTQFIVSPLPLQHATLSHPLKMSILYSEKWLLNLNVSGADTSSTNLPTCTTKHSNSTNLLYSFSLVQYNLEQIQNMSCCTFFSTFSTAWKFIMYSSWFYESQMHMGCFSFIGCISFQIRHSHKAQVLDVLNRMQLPLPSDNSDKMSHWPE